MLFQTSNETVSVPLFLRTLHSLPEETLSQLPINGTLYQNLDWIFGTKSMERYTIFVAVAMGV